MDVSYQVQRHGFQFSALETVLCNMCITASLKMNHCVWQKFFCCATSDEKGKWSDMHMIVVFTEQERVRSTLVYPFLVLLDRLILCKFVLVNLFDTVICQPRANAEVNPGFSSR